MPFRARAYTPQELGLALQAFRANRGLTQRDLASELGISQRYVWELEKGKPGKLTDRLFAILHLLDVRMMLEQAEPEPTARLSSKAHHTISDSPPDSSPAQKRGQS